MILTDQIGKEISLAEFPSKIVSIVPSQTELLSDLGLDDEVIGITKYCVRPKSWREIKTIVGGTKKLNIEAIKKLSPDLIIANKEENEKKQVEELQKLFPVWTSNVKNLEDALAMIEAIGKMTGKDTRALEIQNNIREQFSHFKLAISSVSRKASSVLYLIWKKPYICAGTDTFIDHLLSVCGWENVLASPHNPLSKKRGEKSISRYPELTADDIKFLNPDYIFLSSEPYPFKQKHIEEFRLLCPAAKVTLVDGEMFSWYGSRLLYAPSYFECLLQNL